MKWSNTQIKQIIDEYNQDISCTKIAKEFNVSTATISKLLKDNGVNVINKQNLITFSPKNIISDYNSGISVIKLIKKYHTSYGTIKKIFDENNITIVNKQNRTKFNESIFDNIDSEEKAYWLGFIYADGYISSRDNTFELSLALKDKEHLDKFNVFMQHENDNVKTDSFRCRWSVVNKHLWETLNNYGCTPRKSLTLTFPDISIFSSKSLVRHFIRGYVDGDGSIIVNKPILDILGTTSFLNSLQQYLPYSGSILHNKRSKVYCVRYGCAPAIANIEAIYYKANIFLTRKYNKYLQIRDCRFKAKALKLLEGKIGEGWDINEKLINDIKMEQLCNKCGQIKDISEFKVRKDVKSGYHKICKACRKKQAQKRYDNRSEENYIKCKINSLNNASSRNGNAKNIIKNSSKITIDSIKNLYLQQNKCCFYCKTELSWKDVVFDHAIPLSKGGTHDIDNIRICCKDCNNLKKERTEKEFLNFIFIYIQRFANPELTYYYNK